MDEHRARDSEGLEKSLGKFVLEKRLDLQTACPGLSRGNIRALDLGGTSTFTSLRSTELSVVANVTDHEWVVDVIGTTLADRKSVV